MAKFILIIGNQGSGKSTKARHLTNGKRSVTYLTTYEFVLRKFPIDTEYIVFEEMVLTDAANRSFFDKLSQMEDVIIGSKKVPMPNIIVVAQIDNMAQVPRTFRNSRWKIMPAKNMGKISLSTFF